jgi:hypothetical protein
MPLRRGFLKTSASLPKLMRNWRGQSRNNSPTKIRLGCRILIELCTHAVHQVVVGKERKVWMLCGNSSPDIPFELPAAPQDENSFRRKDVDSVLLAHVIPIGLLIEILFVDSRLRDVAADLRAEAVSIDGAHHSFTFERRQFEFDNVGEAIGIRAVSFSGNSTPLALLQKAMSSADTSQPLSSIMIVVSTFTGTN